MPFNLHPASLIQFSSSCPHSLCRLDECRCQLILLVFIPLLLSVSGGITASDSRDEINHWVLFTHESNACPVAVRLFLSLSVFPALWSRVEICVMTRSSCLIISIITQNGTIVMVERERERGRVYRKASEWTIKQQTGRAAPRNGEANGRESKCKTKAQICFC